MKKVNLTGDSLTIEEVINVAKHGAEVNIDKKTVAYALKSTICLATKAQLGEVAYGATTGFGSLVKKIIGMEEQDPAKRKKLLSKLQVNILRSHASGIGNNFSESIVRAIMVIRLNTLIKGYSGVQEQTINLLKNFINYRIHPEIPEQGSVGSSGDLCPLSHMALPLIGEGYVVYKNKRMPAKSFFKKFGGILNIKPIDISCKEGLALNNGTTVMTAVGAFAIVEAEEILNVGLLTSSLFFEALCARKDFFGFEPLHVIRKHSGQIDIAKAIKKITTGSDYINLFALDYAKLNKDYNLQKCKDDIIKKYDLKSDAERNDEENTLENLLNKKWKPQDSYSIRCTPQVFGASLHAFRHIRSVLSDELNAAVDNPLVFEKEYRIVSGGNFHGQPIALVMDYLKLAVAEVGNIIERQINKLVDDGTNDGLPGFLTNGTGLNSGLMIPQYAAASIVSENKVLVHPASADSIPTCANTEDHVSMGTIAARQALQIVENVRKVIAIAILTSHHGFMLREKQLTDFNLKVKQAPRTKLFYQKVKDVIPALKNKKALDDDRFVYEDIKAIIENWSAFVDVAGSNFKVQ